MTSTSRRSGTDVTETKTGDSSKPLKGFPTIRSTECIQRWIEPRVSSGNNFTVFVVDTDVNTRLGVSYSPRLKFSIETSSLNGTYHSSTQLYASAIRAEIVERLNNHTGFSLAPVPPDPSARPRRSRTGSGSSSDGVGDSPPAQKYDLAEIEGCWVTEIEAIAREIVRQDSRLQNPNCQMMAIPGLQFQTITDERFSLALHASFRKLKAPNGRYYIDDLAEMAARSTLASHSHSRRRSSQSTATHTNRIPSPSQVPSLPRANTTPTIQHPAQWNPHTYPFPSQTGLDARNTAATYSAEGADRNLWNLVSNQAASQSRPSIQFPWNPNEDSDHLDPQSAAFCLMGTDTEAPSAPGSPGGLDPTVAEQSPPVEQPQSPHDPTGHSQVWEYDDAAGTWNSHSNQHGDPELVSLQSTSPTGGYRVSYTSMLLPGQGGQEMASLPNVSPTADYRFSYGSMLLPGQGDPDSISPMSTRAPALLSATAEETER